jgi:hypothetical protein
LKALGRQPGIPALMVAYNTGYEAKSPAAPGGIDMLNIERRPPLAPPSSVPSCRATTATAAADCLRGF